MKYIIILSSETIAHKAQKILSKSRIDAQYTKITGKGGCRHGVKLSKDVDKACRILALDNIKCLEIKKEDRT